jgi:hypothetical protein
MKTYKIDGRYYILPDTIREMEAEIERMRKALRPFSAAVFDDNGDVTISTGHITRHDYMAAQRALRGV